MISSDARTHATGYVMVFIASFCFALVGVLSRYPLAEGVSPIECAFWRAAFGSIFFIIQGIITGAWRVKAKERVVFSLFGIPGVACLFFLYNFSVQEAGAATTVVVANTAPIWVAILSYWVFKEPFTYAKFFSIVLALIGAGLIAFSGGGLPQGSSMIGILAGLGVGFCFSFHVFLGKFYLSDRISAVSIYMYILPVGALCMLPFVDFMPDKSWQAWLSMLMIGFFSNWIGYMALCGGLKRLPAIRLSAFETAVEPFLGALFAFVLWNEMFHPLGWIGAVLLIGAVIMIVVSRDYKQEDGLPIVDR